MSSLFCGPLLKGYSDTLTLTLAPNILGNVANVTATYTALATMVSGITNIMSSDVDFYKQVETQVALFTLSSFVNTINSEPAGRYLIKYLIGTDRLNAILDGN